VPEFNLKRTIYWKQALKEVSADDKAVLEMLGDLQGNILKNHGRDNTVHLFLTFNREKIENVKTFLKALGIRLPSALDQFVKADLFKDKNHDGGLFVAAFLSSQGYQTLDLGAVQPVGVAFNAGMKERTGILSDSNSDQWDAHLAGPVYAMILLAHDNADSLATDTQELRKEIAVFGDAITILGQDTSLVQRNDKGHGIEYFGYAAHIRKTNPGDKVKNSNSRLMARRGITYGIRTDELNDSKLDNKPSDNVGLLFMAYQSSIEKQFEFTQQSWANNADFNFDSPNQPVGIDPVIGQPHGGGLQRYPLHYGVGPLSEPFDFSGFVKLKGGEYFFAPSLSFFKQLPS